MKRNLGIAAIVALGVVVAILALRPGSESSAPVAGDSEVTNGRFSDDSLGVILVQVPQARGWQLRRDRTVPGGPVLYAEAHEGAASWQLFVTPREAVTGLEDVLRRRRDQLAGLFSVKDIDQVIGQVLNEDAKDRDGYPAVQWQAITKPVDVAGSDPIHVMFMWVATLRANYAYEGIGLLKIPVDRAQQSAVTDSLLQDVAFILETMRFQ